MLPVTLDVFVEKYEKLWLINVCELNKSIPVIDENHPHGNIPTPAAIFVYNGAFDIARSVQKVSGCTLFFVQKNTQILHADILWI